MRLTKENMLLNRMNEGEVYRRSDLMKYLTAADRYLARLVHDKKVVRVSSGLYTKPKASAFGAVPPTDSELVESFLKDDRFLVNSLNNYNQLGLGLTQLYNNKVVYNYKRHGEYELNGRTYSFKRLSRFPRKLTKEFLLVDMLNNLKYLAEDQNAVLDNFFKNKNNFDSKKLMRVAKKYARPATLKVLEKAYS